MAESQMILDLSSLPEQARIELFDFYEFLSQKYNVLSSKKALSEANREQYPGDDRSADFMDIFGIWSENDVHEFCRSVEEFDKIDPEDWH